MSRRIRASVVGLSVLSVAAGSTVANAQQGAAVALPEIVVSATPVPTGDAGGIDINKIPADITIVTAKDFERQYKPSVTDAITAHTPAAIALNIDGSDLSPDLFYRGFDASRISGTAAGLAVYENGVRINESFGDTVNLDLIPPIAIASADIYTNNPVFGLNALGGAINFTTKNGFNFQGGDVSILGGSYGRVNGYGEFGKQVGNYSFYFAADGYRDGGYRPFGAQNAERFLLDLGYRSQDSEVHAIGIFGRSVLGVQGVTPQVLVNQQYNSVFTTPQTTNNQAGTAQLTGRFDVSPHWQIASNFYIRQFDQFHTDGNDADVTDCSEIDATGVPGTLCLQAEDAPAGSTGAQLTFIRPNGTAIPSMGPGATDAFPYGSTARSATHTTSFGTQLQATNKDRLYGHDNYFVVGGSVDTGYTHFSSSTTLGQLNAQFQNVESGIPGAGEVLQTAGQVGFQPVYVGSTATYYGVFALDTFNVTKQFAITGGARLNIADISLQDLSGFNPNLNTSENYNRINPVVGATYEFSKAVTFYAGYSEANRAPTPLESQCSNPALPCILETALVSDPPLQQVVSRTYEAGARGIFALPEDHGVVAYKAGYYHVSSTNDILSEASPISGQGYFVNVPETVRQGVEIGVMYNKGPWNFYGNYALVDATYQFTGQLSSPNNPNPIIMANGGTENVVPGNHIPGIPRNLGKLGLDYHVTPRFVVGADTILVGSQYFVGDDTNVNPQLPFYYVLNLHTSYQVTDNVQVFGLINNVTNNKYATYGTYYDTGTDGGNINATLANNNPDNGGAGNANAVTVAQPLSVYGGIKITF